MTHLAFNAPTAVPFQFWIQSWCYKQDVCFSGGAMLLKVLHAQTGPREARLPQPPGKSPSAEHGKIDTSI